MWRQKMGILLIGVAVTLGACGGLESGPLDAGNDAGDDAGVDARSDATADADGDWETDASADGDWETDASADGDWETDASADADSDTGDDGGGDTEGDPTEADDAACSDGVDNDFDGYVDCVDYDCSQSPAITVCGPEEDDAACSDGRDNDGDGYTDCVDYDCSRSAQVTVCRSETGAQACSDGIDNDLDGWTDCQDYPCLLDPNLCPLEQRFACGDGWDNDGDGLVDCADPDCALDALVRHCGAEDSNERCRDGSSNDGDVYVDCHDFDCRPNAGVAVCGAEGSDQAHQVLMDGWLGDWFAVTGGLIDPTGDTLAGRPDVIALKVTHDQRRVVLQLTFNQIVKLDQDHALTLYIDGDDDPSTGLAVHGIGAEIGYRFADHGGFFHGPGGTQNLLPADLGLIGLPVTSANAFELSLDRATLPDGVNRWLTGSTVRVVVADEVAGGDRAPDTAGGLVYSLTGTVNTQLPPLELTRPQAAALRIMSWNVYGNGPLDAGRAEASRRVLQATSPDVICLQEAGAHQALRDQIATWLPLASGSWDVTGLNGVTVLSRYPLVDGWLSDYSPLDTRLMAVLIDAPEGPVQLVCAHLSYGEYDAERQAQADSLIAFWRRLKTTDTLALDAFTPLVLAGDLNLVGHRRQLDTLLTGDIEDEVSFGEDHAPDWDGSALTHVVARHTHHPSAHTWYKPSSNYWPGLLDYVIISDAVIDPVHAYVLETRDMPAAALLAAGLQANDSEVASDHLPVVVDLVQVGD